MKKIFITFLSLILCGLSFAGGVRENKVEATSVQITPEITKAPEPTRTPLTEEDLKRRAQVEKLMLDGEYLHDGAGELKYIGDINSVPALLVVLKKHPPDSNGLMVCTTAHALSALQTITGAKPGIRFEDWNAWREKYQAEQKAKTAQ